NRYVGGTYPFDAWPRAMTDRIIADFNPQAGNLPGLQAGSVNWDHLIYAYLIENTRIYDIFRKVMDVYQHSEQIYTRSIDSQLFWRNTEYLLYSDPAPTTVWQLNGATRKNEQSHRMTVYWRAFGLDLTHADELQDANPYQKPAAASMNFIPMF